MEVILYLKLFVGLSKTKKKIEGKKEDGDRKREEGCVRKENQRDATI